MRVLVAGSTGLIGQALVRRLGKLGHDVHRLVRPVTDAPGVPWDPARGLLDPDALEGIDAVVNLAGRSIGDRRWSDDEKRLLWDSRVGTTRLLATTMAASTHSPALINASAIGYYGDGGDQVLTEESPPGDGFLADLCIAWEEATAPAAEAGCRVVRIRTGIVLSADGGALGRLLAPLGPRWLSPYRWGLGGPVGRGAQWWSWISTRDEVEAIVHLLEGDLAGPVNLVAPQPVTHREFTKALGRALHRPAVIPIPRWLVKVLLGGELARALVLDGQRVTPLRLQQSGFTWSEPDLDGALQAALG